MNNNKLLFNKKKLVVLLAGCLMVVLGFILMSGGNATSYNEFNEEEIFSKVRITYAPIMVMLGYAVCIVGILKRF